VYDPDNKNQYDVIVIFVTNYNDDYTYDYVLTSNTTNESTYLDKNSFSAFYFLEKVYLLNDIYEIQAISTNKYDYTISESNTVYLNF
jgi:hypothetical protein